MRNFLRLHKLLLKNNWICDVTVEVPKSIKDVLKYQQVKYTKETKSRFGISFCVVLTNDIFGEKDLDSVSVLHNCSISRNFVPIIDELLPPNTPYSLIKDIIKEYNSRPL